MARKPKQPNPIERKSWGGPAKGPGNGSPKAPPFEKGNRLAAKENRPSADAFLRASKAERVAKLREMLFNIAETAEGEAVRVAAIDKLWNREEGTPIPAQSDDSGNAIKIIGGLPSDD